MPLLGLEQFLQIPELSRPGWRRRADDQESIIFVQFLWWLQLGFQALSQTWAVCVDAFQEQQETRQLGKP